MVKKEYEEFNLNPLKIITRKRILENKILRFKNIELSNQNMKYQRMKQTFGLTICFFI
jgi:hypothetical protein